MNSQIEPTEEAVEEAMSKATVGVADARVYGETDRDTYDAVKRSVAPVTYATAAQRAYNTSADLTGFATRAATRVAIKVALKEASDGN